jgi:hypothetical protein
MSYTTNISLKNLSAETLNKAALIRAEIDKLERQLTELLSGQVGSSKVHGKKNGRLSELTLSQSMSGNFVKKKKRNLSPEARARIVAAVKARWAREKANSKNKP